MSKRTFNDIAADMQERIAEIAREAGLSIKTVIGVASGRLTGAEAHGEPCRASITRACGGEDSYRTLSRHIVGHDF